MNAGEEDADYYWNQDYQILNSDGLIGACVNLDNKSPDNDAVLLCEVDSVDMWVKVSLHLDGDFYADAKKGEI